MSKHIYIIYSVFLKKIDELGFENNNVRNILGTTKSNRITKKSAGGGKLTLVNDP